MLLLLLCWYVGPHPGLSLSWTKGQRQRPKMVVCLNTQVHPRFCSI